MVHNSFNRKQSATQLCQWASLNPTPPANTSNQQQGKQDAGTGAHGGALPPDVWKGGNGGTSALT